MVSPVDTDYRLVLSLLHQRLHNHFTRLREARDEVAPGTPVFALEHGLSEVDLALVRAAVREAVARDRLPRDAWLPLVIDTAEIGYEFSGDQYWHTYASRTPGWTLLGDRARQYVRSRYRGFRDTYGGVTPSGPWAEKFSIICWPITHAVLPTDLQRHLARLLYEFSRLLTPDLLSDPDELGNRLAARAWQASARFQSFAQNTSMLGQVAAALLTGEDEETPFLLSSTLTRIVADLTRESEARRWLLDAKYLAGKVRTHGFQPLAGHRGGSGGQRQESSVATDPVLSVRESAEGWSLYLELPNLVSLTERLPGVGEEMGRLRPVVAGVTRRFGTGQLLFPGKPERVSRWPESDRPLVQLERGSELTNRMLCDHCELSPGPTWLFRLRDRGYGSEVRGKFVRPAHEYLLVASLPVIDLPTWASAVLMATDGVAGYLLTLPPELDGGALSALKQLGVGAVMDVDVRPVGVVPAAWDGEGTAEWLAGEDAIIAIRSSRSVTNCLFLLDDQPAVLSWPAGANQLFVRLTDLAPGRHHLTVSLFSEEAESPEAAGTLEIAIRSLSMPPSTGTPREGLMLLPSPASPTLDEVWDGRASVEVLGPPGARVRASIALSDRLGLSLVSPRIVTLTLPVDSARWLNIFATQVRRHDNTYNAYDQAESCVVTVSSPELGRVTLRCERGFKPLRWAFGRDHRDGPYVSLVDNTDGVPVTITTYEFARPCEVSAWPPETAQQLHLSNGGLVVADAGSTRAAVILPPHVRRLQDLRSEPPHLPTIPRAAADIIRMIEFADLWGKAALPADPVGALRRTVVLRSFAETLTALVAGLRWSRSEGEYIRRGSGDPRVLSDAIGAVPYQRLLASGLAEKRGAFHAADVAGRVTALAALLSQHARPAGVDGIDRRLAEFLLRLTTEPGTLISWPAADLESLLGRALESPLLVRAARFLVVTTDTGEDLGSVYAGWTWA